jgi:anti-sigma factor RsiW
MMNLDDALLMSYVDGELAPQQRAKIEAAIAHSPDLAARLAAMRASCLPYSAAFEQRADPPPPESLTRRINELASVSAPREWRRWRFAPQWLAVAFFVGVTSSGVVFQMASGGPPFRAAVAPWVQAASDYQDLYVRETVAPITEERTVTMRVLAGIQHRDGMPIHVPDLRNVGLSFKRVQRLSYRNEPLIQMVYLPTRGEPVALCAMEDSRPDEGVKVRKVGDLNVVTWRHDNLAYALLGKGVEGDLRRVGQEIAEGKTSDLYGEMPAASEVPAV